jgi:hypothetical protein
MATVTGGTVSTVALTCVLAPSASQGLANWQPFDIATIKGALRSDTPDRLHVPGCFNQNGSLYIPNRGLLKVLPGDMVCVDTNGWPVLVSAQSLGAGGAWQHS